VSVGVDTLTPADLQLHEALGIPPQLLAEAGVRRVTHQEARRDCGIRYKSDHLEGIWYPNRDPESGRIRGGRVRRDHPEVDHQGKPIAKYVAPPGRHHLYFAPGAVPMLADPSVTIVVVEGGKSVLAVTGAARRAGRRLLPIGLGGCWGWKGTIGKTTDAQGARVDEKGPLPDLDRVTWHDRDVVIVFDANATTNAKVQAARLALGKDLNTRGARVRIAELSTESDVNGPDDFIGKHGDAALFALLDAAKPVRRTTKHEKSEKPKQGGDVQLEAPEPWPDPVDGAELLNSVTATFRKYLALPAHADVALALWVLMTYVFDAFFVAPKLAITSPVRRCGKSFLLIVLGALVPRGLLVSNVSASALFRVIQKFKPTLLIDEADTFVKDNEELRGIMNSGHTRKTAFVMRCVGEDHEPRLFSTWCPQAMALIGELSDTLADRSIHIRQRRRGREEKIERLRQDRIDAECESLRRQAARWAADYGRQLQDADPTVPTALHDRAADCWRPLLALADRAGQDWPTRARAAALALTGSAVEQDVNIELLHDIFEVFEDAGVSFIASSDLATKLGALDSRPWGDWKNGKPMTTRALADLLKAFGIVPKANTAGTARGYDRDRFEDAWARYPAPKPSNRQSPNETGPEPPFSTRQTASTSDTSKTQEMPINSDLFDGLTVSTPDHGHGDGQDDAGDGFARPFDA
jgi:putative DNA primase/helicase